MTNATTENAGRTWIWHPWMFAVFPVLTLYHANVAEVPPGEVFRPLAITLAVAALLWGATTRLLRDVHKAALCCSFTLLLLFLYGHVRAILLHSASPVLVEFGQDGPFLFRPWLFVWLLGLLLILRARRSLCAWSAPLNVAGVPLVLLPVFGIGRALILPPLQPTSVPAPTLATTTPPEMLPNIYYIVLDGYAREDTLQRLYHYDNRPFLADLQRRGFYVARNSRANYSQTNLSLPSTLQMAYLEAAPGGPPRGRLSNLSDTAAIRLLRRQGYRTVALDSEYYLQLERPDRFIPFPAEDASVLTPFEEQLVHLTPLALCPQPKRHGAKTGYERHRRKIRFQLNQLPAAADETGPVFIFAHILCPHPPFVLGHDADPDRPYDIKDGNYFLLEGGTREEYLAGYPAQLDDLNRLLMKVIDRLVKHSRRPTVIILQSDHGPGAYTDWDQPGRTDFQERMPNLCAIYTPDGPLPDLYQGITPVNTFRLLFNHYLHTDYPRLPDRCYFSTPARPFDFIDVTDRVR
ncbi:MAG: sulfatase-like hydrolase/transferase [Armatimonadota bacterium]